MRRFGNHAPVNFVYLTDFDEAAARVASSIDTFIAASPDNRFAFAGTRADLNMCALSYFYLREAGIENVELSRAPRPGAINVLHSEHLRRLGPQPDCFCVCVQGDYPARPFAQFHIVQNRDQLRGDSAVIWLWPHPGIVGRDAARGETFRRIGYLGQIERNLADEVAAWEAMLAPLGLDFVTRPASEWHDFSSLDAVIGIREFSPKSFSDKPPSKLVNAWLAGVPFIGGADSAFAQIGEAGIDHLRATSRQCLIDSLVLLRDDTDLRAALVSAGRLRAREFTREALVNRWSEVIAGPIAERYDNWQKRPHSEAWRTKGLGVADRGLELAKAAVRRLRRANAS